MLMRQTDLLTEIDAHLAEKPKPTPALALIMGRYGADRVRLAEKKAAEIIEAVRMADYRESGLRDLQAGHLTLHQKKLMLAIADALLIGIVTE